MTALSVPPRNVAPRAFPPPRRPRHPAAERAHGAALVAGRSAVGHPPDRRRARHPAVRGPGVHPVRRRPRDRRRPRARLRSGPVARVRHPAGARRRHHHRRRPSATGTTSNNWLRAAFTSSQLVGRTVSRGRATRSPRSCRPVRSSRPSPTTRCASARSSRSPRHFLGSLVAYGIVAVLMLRVSVPLGLVVDPRPADGRGDRSACSSSRCQRRQAAQREASGRLTTLGADTVSGLRILRGIGGEDGLHRPLPRAVAGDASPRRRGGQDAVGPRRPPGAAARARSSSCSSGSARTWRWRAPSRPGSWSRRTASRRSCRGRCRTPRRCCRPRRARTSARPRWSRSCRSSRRRVRRPARPPRRSRTCRWSTRSAGCASSPAAWSRWSAPTPTSPRASPRGSAGSTTRRSRTPRCASAACCCPSSTRTHVRERIVVAEATPHLFSGLLERASSTCAARRRRTTCCASSRRPTRTTCSTRCPTASPASCPRRAARCPAGQRQRVALARALLIDPEILVLVEPTSAVDAHTEARIAARLADVRRGRTTLVVTASPLVLDHVDEVAFVQDGVVRARGSARRPARARRRRPEVARAYRAVVGRQMDEEAPDASRTSRTTSGCTRN